MKRHLIQALLFFCVLCVHGHGKARWHDMDTGLSEADVFTNLGAPLIMHRGRGYVQWTYDAGGAVMFRQGTVIYWDAPSGYRFVPPAAAPSVAAAKVTPAAKNTPAVGREPTPEPRLIALAKLHPGNYDRRSERLASEAFVAVRVH